jgi:hypothetical protein
MFKINHDHPPYNLPETISVDDPTSPGSWHSNLQAAASEAPDQIQQSISHFHIADIQREPPYFI